MACGRNLLIIGQHHDPHVIEVATRLAPNRVSIFDHYRPDNAEPGVINFNNTGFIWWRGKPFVDNGTPKDKNRPLHTSEELTFHNSEWWQYFRNLSEKLPADVQLDKLSNTIAAENKITQLDTAQQVGIRTPRYEISNDAVKLQDFVKYSNSEHFVFKTLSGLAPYPTHSSELKLAFDRNDLAEMLLLDLHTPILIQEYISKKFEWRIIILGENAISIMIDSQKHEGLQNQDWRVEESNSEMFCIDQAPHHVIDNSISYLRKLKIKSGVFDYIQSDTGEFFFLECNTAGQWAAHGEHITCEVAEMFSQYMEKNINE